MSGWRHRLASRTAAVSQRFQAQQHVRIYTRNTLTLISAQRVMTIRGKRTGKEKRDDVGRKSRNYTTRSEREQNTDKREGEEGKRGGSDTDCERTARNKFSKRRGDSHLRLRRFLVHTSSRMHTAVKAPSKPRCIHMP